MRTYSTRTLLLLLLLLQPVLSNAADPLGRLFFSAAERLQIDQHQQEDHPALPPPRLDGIITRSAGTPTLFLDGKSAKVNPGQVYMPEGTARVAGADGRVHRLKVGDPPPESRAR